MKSKLEEAIYKNMHTEYVYMKYMLDQYGSKNIYYA